MLVVQKYKHCRCVLCRNWKVYMITSPSSKISTLEYYFVTCFFFFSSHSNTLEVITRHYIKLYCNSFWAAQYFTVWLNHNIFNQSLFEKDIQGLFSMLLL